MSRLFIPAIHLPHGRELFKPLPYRPAVFKRALKCCAERALLQCGSDDVVVLPARPEENYLDFLTDAGLGTRNIIVCEGKGENFAMDILADKKVMAELSSHTGVTNTARITSTSFYIHLEEEREIARRLGVEGSVMHPSLTRMFNTLYFLCRLEEDLGLHHPGRMQIRSCRFSEPANRLLEKHGALFVRGNESIGGSQVFIIRTLRDVEETVKKISRNRHIIRYFASPYLEISASWNIQYALENGAAVFFGASRQILDGGTHKGNRSGEPAPKGIMEVADLIAGRLADMGAAGMIGIDLVIHEGKTYAVEINARHNTSTPALDVLNRISSHNKNVVFETFGMDVGHGFTFAAFVKLAGRRKLFDPAVCSGFLPYHFSASRITGRIDVAVFARDAIELKEMTNALRRTGSL
ncbi:MAG: hypothetical protein IEMM0002_0075 [bacterium]|nr:MAG: hypothetical protein IEMM0002_0075 [bacterium]